MLVKMPCKGKLEMGMPAYADNEGYVSTVRIGVADTVGWVVDSCNDDGDIATVSIATWTSLPLGINNTVLINDDSGMRWEPPMSEVITCAYCSRIYNKGQRRCWDGVNGCGAPLLE